jgi:predicted ATPase
VKGIAHYDKALAFYDPAKHRALITRFGQDVGVVVLSLRALALWLLGYPDHARADIESALANAREIGHAVTLMYALINAAALHMYWGNYQEAISCENELAVLAEQTDAPFWKAGGIGHRGCIFSLTGDPSAAVDAINSAVTVWRSMGATIWMTMYLPHLAKAYAGSARFDDAWRCIREASTLIETTKETLWEAEVQRTAGEIALKSPEPDAAKAEAYFNRALAVARKQQAKSWELRAAMSMARLWRDQGKRDEARELLAPVYGWFTEGFETRDLKGVKALLDELSS